MCRTRWLAVLGFAALLAGSPAVQAQPRPYIGLVYPAGGRQGTTFQIRLGGQNLDDVNGALISGPGVRAKVVEYYKRLNNQETSLLREQVNELRKGTKPATGKDSPAMGKDSPAAGKDSAPQVKNPAEQKLIDRIEKRLAEYVNTPACSSLSSLAFIEVTIAPDASPGQREIRLVTPRGVSNPLVFMVGQVGEYCRKPMLGATLQVLGKEELSLRKRPDDEVEAQVAVPCALNGQIASGEVNRYRFEARKGQRLVISVAARQLIPFIADAVPGWFQPVLTLYDAGGKELAYDDDYLFKPDPVIYYEVPQDGQYLLNITDAIYRGREDFVYRITVGELPFVRSLFPLGGRVGSPVKVEMKGWNLQKAELIGPPQDAGPGIHMVAARRDALVSNTMPFALDTLSEAFDKEPNNDAPHAQKVQLPVIINGRIDRPDDWDVFQITGKAGDSIVAEVQARRLDSPLDSILKLTDAAGNVLAMNDDHDDPGYGVNTHPADSYLLFKLPADGAYYVHLGDTARNGGEEYAYRLRLSQPRPDFALYAVPSSLAISSKTSAGIPIQVVRKDGYAGPINLVVKDPPGGFSSSPVTVPPGQAKAWVPLKTTLVATTQPVTLRIQGRVKTPREEVVRELVSAEDRMQAFLWRHLVPAQEMKVLVFDPSYTPPPKRGQYFPLRPPPATKPPTPPPPTPPPATPPPATPPATPPAQAKPPTATANKPKFTKSQVAGRLRQIKILYDEGLLTDEFNDKKVEECEAGAR